MLFSPFLIILVVLAFYLIGSIKILNEYERAVIFRLGKLLPAPKGPGVVLEIGRASCRERVCLGV